MKKKTHGPMLPLEQALEVVLGRVAPLGRTEVSIYQAPGAVLADEIRADRDYPPFDKSAMDGFAVVAADTTAPPRRLPVVETIAAGAVPTRKLAPGEAAAIMTGAPLPEGADAVIPVESTEPEGDDAVVLQGTVRPGQHVCRRGEDLREGEIALPAGTMIRAAEMAILASVGREAVPIHRKPSVAIISTGDELVDVGVPPGAHQIRNSNGYALWTQARSMEVPAHLLGIAPDREDAIRAKVEEALRDDVVLISGGVSMGEFDLVGGVLASLGLEVAFDRVAVKPGKPTLFGTIRGKPVFGLPGNPVSGFVIFQLLVRPAILRMLGVETPRREEVEAVLEEGELRGTKRHQFLPAALRYADGGFRVRRVEWQGSGDLFGPARGNAFLQVPVDSPTLEAGARVRCLLLPGSPIPSGDPAPGARA